MEKLTKEQVYVSITSDEEAVKLRDLLQKAGEPIYGGSNILLGKKDSSDNPARHYTEDGGWQYGGNHETANTEVTLQQLAEILAVKQQFKVGDRVRCINRVDIMYKGGAWKEGKEFIVGEVRDTSIGIYIFPDGIKSGVYAPFLELVEAGKETTIKTVAISRANLGRLYPIVCSSWQSYITSLLDDAGSFAVEVQVPLEKLKQAYSAADYRQKAILIEVAPLPKVKSTVKVSRWVNVYEKTASIIGTTEGVGNKLYTTKKDAIRNKAQIGYIDTIELTGEYTTEVEDPLMDIDEIPF